MPGSVLRALALAPLLVLTTAWTQQAAPTAGASKDQPVDEVIVRGKRTLVEMRLEVQLARERVFDEFNKYNSDDDFDIHCEQKRLTGKHLETRVCSPVFANKATAKAGKDFTRRMQRDCADGVMCEKGLFNGAAEAQQVQGRLGVMNKRLDDEIQRVSLEHPEVAKAIDEYNAKERAYLEEAERRKN